MVEEHVMARVYGLCRVGHHVSLHAPVAGRRLDENAHRSPFFASPIWERRGLYRQAANALEVLLFGSCTNCPKSLHSRQTTALAPLLLSRRARGKAIDRLIIDYTHIHRQHCADEEKATKRAKSEKFQLEVATFSTQILKKVALTSSMGFSSIRTLARRLKKPLSETLASIDCLEARELGLRLRNSNVVSIVQKPAKRKNEDSKKYSDWTPITDYSIANALNNDDNGAGARCAFVGFEDEGNEQAGTTSLNVEELAMELYYSGRLPENVDSPDLKGGWVGWHDEGGHIRALFRILCSAPILGMDWGCSYDGLRDDTEKQEHITVHLSPYQSAPFDLHVGYELNVALSSQDKGSVTSSPTIGFFSRRSAAINAFLDELEQCSGQALCDLVYDSISARLQHMNAHKQKDPFVDSDRARTLSAVACGFGGRQLAAMFRCFFFDYRHYSGGLPDLHLFRALYEDAAPGENPFVDLGEWIGEAYSIESQQEAAARRGAAIISDRDDEFLGCSKVGDSGGLASRGSRSGKQLSNSANTLAQSKDMLPERLQLVHNGRKIKVECMMVEVKSSNDRLDARQEDWLNVLTLHDGNARVCKFTDTSKSKKKAVKKSTSGVTETSSV